MRKRICTQTTASLTQYDGSGRGNVHLYHVLYQIDLEKVDQNYVKLCKSGIIFQTACPGAKEEPGIVDITCEHVMPGVSGALSWW